MIMIGSRKVYVDGFDSSTHKVYEFLGDFYHGCPVTFPDRCMRHPKHDNKTMQEVYEITMERLKAIEQAGYGVEVIWEHKWNQLKREREGVKEFVNALNLVSRLEPRDAFFGGRTNAVQLYRRVEEEEGEEIWYVDYTSLYPWVNKNCLSCGTSGHHHATRSVGKNRCASGVFWIGEMYRVTTLRFTFCRVAPSLRRQVNVSTMSIVRGDTAAATAHPKDPLLPSHGRGASVDGDVVHAGTESGRGQRIRHHASARGVALS